MKINGIHVHYNGRHLIHIGEEICLSWAYEQIRPDDPVAALVEMVRDYREGMSLAELERRYAVSRASIREIMIKLREPLRTRGGQQTSHRARWATKRTA